MATGVLPFQGDTSAVVFDAILNRDPTPVNQLNPSLPQVGPILDKALEKDRVCAISRLPNSRPTCCGSRRDLDSGRKRSWPTAARGAEARVERRERPIAVLYFENVGGAERRRVPARRHHRRHHHRAFEDQGTARVLAAHGACLPRQAGDAGADRPAAFGGLCARGHLRRSGSRLRINAQLVDTHTDFPLWSERYDREMQDIFELQDEIARKIAEALRVTLSPQEQAELAAKPTENLQAYDLYLRGRSMRGGRARQDLEFARECSKGGGPRSDFALAYAAVAYVCALHYYRYGHGDVWMERAKAGAAGRATALQPHLPEADVARPGSATPTGSTTKRPARTKRA